jgi:hypothetical protein
MWFKARGNCCKMTHTYYRICWSLLIRTLSTVIARFERLRTTWNPNKKTEWPLLFKTSPDLPTRRFSIWKQSRRWARQSQSKEWKEWKLITKLFQDRASQGVGILDLKVACFDVALDVGGDGRVESYLSVLRKMDLPGDESNELFSWRSSDVGGDLVTSRSTADDRAGVEGDVLKGVAVGLPNGNEVIGCL